MPKHLLFTISKRVLSHFLKRPNSNNPVRCAFVRNMASTESNSLADILSGPGPKVTVQRVDFAKTQLPELSKFYAVILDDVLTAAECNQLVEAAEATSSGIWEQAMVNTGNNKQALLIDIRDCGRIIWDDRQVVRLSRIAPQYKLI